MIIKNNKRIIKNNRDISGNHLYKTNLNMCSSVGSLVRSSSDFLSRLSCVAPLLQVHLLSHGGEGEEAESQAEPRSLCGMLSEHLGSLVYAASRAHNREQARRADP